MLNDCQVVHIFSQLVEAVEHVHSKGLLHGDLKPLNFVRIDGRWCIIDMDASARIGLDPMGDKYSSAYIPPEAVYADAENGIIGVRSRSHALQCEIVYELLIAHPSYDVWALGCILYHLCTGASLFKESKTENLSMDPTDEDSLWTLAEWSEEVVKKKLSKVSNVFARNLLAQVGEMKLIHLIFTHFTLPHFDSIDYS